MAVAIGASCAFLTPIGHQNNTLILGPGGFRFGDYWRLGLPLEILVVAVSVPMLLLVWPQAEVVQHQVERRDDEQHQAGGVARPKARLMASGITTLACMLVSSSSGSSPATVVRLVSSIGRKRSRLA
jgi:Na+/H+ antiporter NhaD/arsenite permease-like protein